MSTTDKDSFKINNKTYYIQIYGDRYSMNLFGSLCRYSRRSNMKMIALTAPSDIMNLECSSYISIQGTLIRFISPEIEML
jgi:hypothetical protein